MLETPVTLECKYMCSCIWKGRWNFMVEREKLNDGAKYNVSAGSSRTSIDLFIAMYMKYTQEYGGGFRWGWCVIDEKRRGPETERSMAFACSQFRANARSFFTLYLRIFSSCSSSSLFRVRSPSYAHIMRPGKLSDLLGEGHDGQFTTIDSDAGGGRRERFFSGSSRSLSLYLDFLSHSLVLWVFHTHGCFTEWLLRAETTSQD